MNSKYLGHRQIALLTDGYTTPFLAKTAINLLRYRNDDIAGLIDQSASGTTAAALLGVGGSVPVVGTLDEVPQADAIYVGIAPPGGKLPAEWKPILLAAIQRKIDVVSGLHDFLVEDEDYVHAADRSGARLVDVRRNQHKSTALGRQFLPTCVRIHCVGHDCSIGKMVTTKELELGLRAAGQDARFLATGQTGMMVSGSGVPVDCVVADFVNGAIEQLVGEHEGHDFLLVEGQGSISHPAYSAVTLGLLHGCAPDGLVFCYEAGRKHVKGFDGIDIPAMAEQMRACEVLANLRHPCKFIGIAVNTRTLSQAEALAEIERVEAEFGLPACDVYRTGSEKLVAASMALREEVLAR